MARYRLNNIKTALEAKEDEVFFKLKEAVFKEYGSKGGEVYDYKIVKKSVDARDKGEVLFVYAAEFCFDGELCVGKDLIRVEKEDKVDFAKCCKDFHYRPAIVGSGPAGMMAALCLAEAGARPIVLERGAEVLARKAAVERFFKSGVLDERSNVQFGEGGAGTFSDGKLMTGIKKDKFCTKVLGEFAAAGAPKEILYLAKPHIGTDNLVVMVQNIRRKIEKLGGEYRFLETLSDIKVEGETLKAAVVTDAAGKTYEIKTDTLVLALGHSARDTFKMLYERGVQMAQKPFAAGVRIEHLQKDINLAQFGKKFCNDPHLGAADYKLAAHLDGERGVYTFCMCPGGQVIGATNLAGHVVTNGMSEFARDKENANAAVLVNVGASDFGSEHPLAGIWFQEELEKKAFEAGGCNYFAPAQLWGDFAAGRRSTGFGRVKPTYKPGVTPADLRDVFPAEICNALKEGILLMDKKLKGFANPDAVLTAVESRSSSPVRILRGVDFMSNIKGIYPIGEGAGYAGGITSAAADGVKAAFLLAGFDKKCSNQG